MNISNTSGSLTRRDREREARRREIIEAAVQVFAEKGYEQATLDGIAQRAEFGKGTIYHYFKSKEDLFIELLRFGLGQFHEIAVAAAQTSELSSAARFKNFTASAIKFFKENELFYRVVLNEHHKIHIVGSEDLMKLFIDGHAGIVKVLGKVLEEGVKKKEIKPLPPLKMADVFMQMLHGIAFSNICKCKDIFRKEDGDLITTIFFNGVLNPEAEISGTKGDGSAEKRKRGE